MAETGSLPDTPWRWGISSHRREDANGAVSYVNIKRPPTVFIRDLDGSVYMVNSPSVSADTLRGQDVSVSEEFALSIREVDAVGVRSLDKAKTSALVSGGVLFGTVVTYGILNAGSGDHCVRRARDPGQCATPENAKY